MNNIIRADRGVRAIAAGNADHMDSVQDGRGGWQTSLSDTLANIMHACDLYRLDFDGAVESARMQHQAETHGEA